MGESIIAGLLRGKLVEPRQIVGSEPRAERREQLAAQYGVRMVASNLEAAVGAIPVASGDRGVLSDKQERPLMERRYSCLIRFAVTGVALRRVKPRCALAHPAGQKAIARASVGRVKWAQHEIPMDAWFSCGDHRRLRAGDRGQPVGSN